MTRPSDIPAWAWEKAVECYYGVTLAEFDRLAHLIGPHDDLERIARALMEAGPVWNDDMEAAPRDGTEIDIWACGRRFADARYLEPNDIIDWPRWVAGDGTVIFVADASHWRPKPLPPSDLIKSERTIDGAKVGVVFPEPNETSSVVSHNNANLEDKSGWLSPDEAKETGNV